MATIVQPHEKECVVCMNDFTTPKILPCGHLLCRQCLISWLDSKPDAGCPLCTCPIVEHPGNSSQNSADVVDALPTDYVMEAIVESAHVLGKEDICTGCDDLIAEYICMQCVEKMCLSCMKIHEKMVATRSHEVESLSTVTPERLAASRPALCADHGDKEGELFCARHHLVFCASCFSPKHNECPNVKHLDNEMRSAETALGALTQVLTTRENNLKQAIGDITVRTQTTNATEEQNMALVDKTCDRLQKMVEECRQKLKKLVSDSTSNFNKSLYDVKSELEKRVGKVTSHKHLVTRATTVRPRHTLIHAAQTLTDRVHSLDLSSDLEVDAWVSPSPEIREHCDDVVKVMKAELHSMELQLIDVEKPVLVFDENCGTNICLTNCQTTAKMILPDAQGNGVVMSRDSMALNVLYEVKIDKINKKGQCGLLLGVTRIPPAQSNVPMLSEELRESIIIWESGVRRKDINIKCNVAEALKVLKVGSRVGLLVDSSNNLHFYSNGQDQGVVAKNIPQPSFAVFDLFKNILQVTALPTSKR